MAPTPSDHASLLAPWRHDLVTRLIHAFAIIALAALVPGAIAAYRLGKPVILLIDILAYLMLYPAYRLRKRHFTAATVILISSQLAVGGVLMIGVGVEGAALLWLLAPLILANLLLGGRPTIAVLVVAASIFGGYVGAPPSRQAPLVDHHRRLVFDPRLVLHRSGDNHPFVPFSDRSPRSGTRRRTDSQQ
jgi:hypothetical protein